MCTSLPIDQVRQLGAQCRAKAIRAEQLVERLEQQAETERVNTAKAQEFLRTAGIDTDIGEDTGVGDKLVFLQQQIAKNHNEAAQLRNQTEHCDAGAVLLDPYWQADPDFMDSDAVQQAIRAGLVIYSSERLHVAPRERAEPGIIQAKG
jgi:hypothetical protein